MKQQLLAMCELHASPRRGRSSYFESSCAGRLLGLQPYLEFSDFIFAYFDAKLYQRALLANFFSLKKEIAKSSGSTFHAELVQTGPVSSRSFWPVATCPWSMIFLSLLG